MARNDFNDAYITSRYKAFDAEGKYKGIVSLTNDSKRRYEAKGFTFTRTSLRASGEDNPRYGSRT